jgi:hypothetical protein
MGWEVDFPHGPYSYPVDPAVFRTAIVAAAIMAAVSTLDALALSPDAGSLVSGHRPLGSEHENDLANSQA